MQKSLKEFEKHENMEIAEIIFFENLKNIRKTIESSFVNKVPSMYMEFTIEINLIILCNIHPVLVNQMVRDFLPCKEAIETLVKEEIKEKYSKENIEYTQLVNFKDLFDILIRISHIPIQVLKTQIKNIYGLIQPKYSITQTDSNIFDNNPILEVVSNVSIPLLTFKGMLTELKTKIKNKSSFYLCVNKNCHDRTYVLKLKNISYNFMDSKKTFTFSSETLTSTCFNCKTQLEELIKKRITKKTYLYILSDTKFHLICESKNELSKTELSKNELPKNELPKNELPKNELPKNELTCEIPKKEFYLTGYLFRRERGHITFSISTIYFVEMKDKINLKIAQVEINQSDKFSSDLMRLTSIYFYDFKCICLKEDVLLFIIINILNLSDKRILLMTSDPVYVFRCCQNILKNQKISYKPFNEDSGICIRDYNEGISKKVKFDYTFNLTINSLLDYKYTEPDKKNSKIILKPANITSSIYNNTLYSSQTTYPYCPVSSFPNYESVQMLFLEFREFYKGKIEPEKLLDSLLYLYKSIENIMQGEKEQHYATFIRNNFKGKMI